MSVREIATPSELAKFRLQNGVVILDIDGAECLVDEVDFEPLMFKRWRVLRNHGLRYAYAQTKDRRLIYMHRAIMAPAARYVVDHVNGNGLDNRRINLRTCCVTENRWNTRARSNKTGYTGVEKRGNRYYVQIRFFGMSRRLGSFASAEAAHAAYCEAAKRYRGDTAQIR